MPSKILLSSKCACFADLALLCSCQINLGRVWQCRQGMHLGVWATSSPHPLKDTLAPALAISSRCLHMNGNHHFQTTKKWKAIRLVAVPSQLQPEGTARGPMSGRTSSSPECSALTLPMSHCRDFGDARRGFYQVPAIKPRCHALLLLFLEGSALEPSF